LRTFANAKRRSGSGPPSSSTASTRDRRCPLLGSQRGGLLDVPDLPVREDCWP
jgi:hypothetical protein